MISGGCIPMASPDRLIILLVRGLSGEPRVRGGGDSTVGYDRTLNVGGCFSMSCLISLRAANISCLPSISAIAPFR